MRKLVLLGLMLWGSASAATLYTVTVKTTQVIPNTRVAIVPMDKKLEKRYTFHKDASSGTFKVPAGKYAVMAYQVNPIEKAFDATVNYVTVNKTGSFVIKPKLLPKIDGSIRSAWNSLLITLNATNESCATPQTNYACANVDVGFDIVKSLITLEDSFVQVGAWTHLDSDYLAYFQVGGVQLSMIALPRNGHTFLLLSRNE